MNKVSKVFQPFSVGFIIITACVAIIFVLVASLLIATFATFRTGINDAINIQTRELSTQIVYNYEASIASIIGTSNTIQADIDGFDSIGSEAFSEYLTQIVRLSSDIIKVSIYDYESQVAIASSEESDIHTSTIGANDSWFFEALEDPTVHVFSTPYAEIGSGEYRVNVGRRIRYQGGARTGVLLIEISFQSFIDLVDKSNLGEGGHVMIIDSYYNVVYTSMPEQETVREGLELVSEIILGSRSAVLGGYSMAVNVDTLSNTKWRICVFINIDQLVEIEQTFLLTTILVSSIVLIIGVILLTVVARGITRPMKQLELAMRKVEKSDYFRMEEVELVASREVKALTGRFNRMMRKIGELMDHVISEQNAQRKSELKALQNQINPHFLYNTLDSILWLIENERNKDAAEMLVALARLFRIGISNDSMVISVSEEMEHVRNYLLIQNIRYAGSFEYSFDIEPVAAEIVTLKLILQPIVENCIYHGLKNKIDKGKIIIKAYIDGDHLLLSVSDNGYGMRQERIDSLYSSFEDKVVNNSVGLKNIYQRVMIYYGGNAGMVIESVLDEGTTITIKQKIT
ncbi:MAG: sensor histidine kinase [Oscillospiraceae bacterium]|nr:sensor histidine kinase [Oscillospiraceae bacterium]